MNSKNKPSNIVEIRTSWLVIAQLIGLAAMIVVTDPLWFESSGSSDAYEFRFPSIPLLEAIGDLGRSLTWAISSLLILAILLALGFAFWNISIGKLISIGVVLLMLIASVVLNQHRFLPWVYQSILVFGVVLTLNRKEQFRFFRMLCVSIYVFSAISKFDYQFIHSTGLNMFKTLAGFAGLDVSNWSIGLTSVFVFCFPLLELLIGIGLLFALTRTVAMIGACFMHLSLILILGPFGVDNAESVLIWNMLFIVQVLTLYLPAKVTGEKSKAKNNERKSIVCQSLVFVLFLVPISEKLNIVDHWPAWGLYSPSASRCKLLIPRWKAEQLPDEFKIYLRESKSEFQVMQEFDMAAWSIDSTNTPIYPQDRFQFGVAKFLVEKLKLERSFQIEIQSKANRLTGKRKIEKITEAKELERFGDKNFFVNSTPF